MLGRCRWLGLMARNSCHFFLHLRQLLSFPARLLVQLHHFEFESSPLLSNSLIFQLFLLKQVNFMDRIIFRRRIRSALRGCHGQRRQCWDIARVGRETSRQAGSHIRLLLSMLLLLLLLGLLGASCAVAWWGDEGSHGRLVARGLLGSKSELVHDEG
jgi:hypothetical protein